MSCLIYLYRRADREPSAHSRICSCHFRDGEKCFGPEIYARNAEKVFPSTSSKGKAKRSKQCDEATVEEIAQKYRKHATEPGANEETLPINENILQAELDSTRADLEKERQENVYKKTHYTASKLNEAVIRMETGLPTKEIFEIVVKHVSRFVSSINYHAGWKVVSISFEDQIFITLMKLRQNYTYLHLAQLFSCCVATIANIISTFIPVLHKIFFKHIMVSIPSREKNELCLPSSFSFFTNCRIIIDCTDIEIAKPSLMSHQSATYSSYRGMNSFKVLVGVAPNGVITFVSNLYPGSISDKEIVRKSGLLSSMETGDLILADKGFLIHDMVPTGVAVNVPPFLHHGRFTESEAIATKNIARCRIHVERVNARLKDFKILTFVPSALRSSIDTVFQLCAALVNLQFPLIKERCEGTEFDSSLS